MFCSPLLHDTVFSYDSTQERDAPRPTDEHHQPQKTKHPVQFHLPSFFGRSMALGLCIFKGVTCVSVQKCHNFCHARDRERQECREAAVDCVWCGGVVLKPKHEQEKERERQTRMDVFDFTVWHCCLICVVMFPLCPMFLPRTQNTNLHTTALPFPCTFTSQ